MTKRMVSKSKYKYVLPPLSSLPITTTDATTTTKTTTTTTTTTKEAKETATTSLAKQKGRKTKCGRGTIYPYDIPEQRFFTIAELNENDFFNVGEDLEGLYVISVGRVEVVQIATLAFSRHSSGRLLDEMRRKYVDFLPTGKCFFFCKK